MEGETAGAIGHGLVVLVGVQVGDSEDDALYIADKVLNLRVFGDDDGKMNRTVVDVDGGALVISQFTLLGDVRRGRRPSFIEAARPEQAEELYESVCLRIGAGGVRVATGVFGAHMLLSLVNDGPVTIQLDSRRLY